MTPTNLFHSPIDFLRAHTPSFDLDFVRQKFAIAAEAWFFRLKIARTFHALSTLSDRQLADIGTTREGLRDHVYKIISAEYDGL